jgi:hypothetical protein
LASGFGVLDFFVFGVFQCVVYEVLVHLFQPFVRNIKCLSIKHLAQSLCVERVVVSCFRGFWVAVWMFVAVWCLGVLEWKVFYVPSCEDHGHGDDWRKLDG